MNHLNVLLAVLDFQDFITVAFAIMITAVPMILSGFSNQKFNLNRIERKLDALLQHHGIELPSGLSPEVQRLAMESSQKIAAIKLCREQTGLGLKEAKEAVEEFQKSAMSK